MVEAGISMVWRRGSVVQKAEKQSVNKVVQQVKLAVSASLYKCDAD